MEYTVNSLKDAIYISIKKLNYDINNVDVIKKLIYYAIEGKYNYFTKSYGARDYIKSKKKNEILKEIIYITKTLSSNIEDIVEEYIKKYFKPKNNNININTVKSNSNLSKVSERIELLDKNSINKENLKKQLWNDFINIFMGYDKVISKEEIRYDMILAALLKSESYRDNAGVLKKIDLNSKDLTQLDAIKLVEEYVSSNNIDSLINGIDKNGVLSGLLMQNLFDYTYFKKLDQDNSKSLNILDNIIMNIPDLNDRADILLKVLNEEDNHSGIDRERLIVDLLKNTLILNMYTYNKRYIDYDERRLYSGNINLDEETIEKRIIKNNEIANNILVNGTNSNIDDIIKLINNLDETDLYFLTHMYVISRSLNENKERLNNAIYNGSKEHIYLLGLLESESLIEQLKENMQNHL